MSILDELYEGNICPAENEYATDSEYNKCRKLYLEDVEQLRSLLKGQEKEVYDKTLENLFNLNYIAEKESFVKGFCLGAKLMLEILRN